LNYPFWMNERLFAFKINGVPYWLSIAEAIALKNPEVTSRINEITNNLKNKRMLKDGFTPGMQDNINEVINNRSDYDRRLRELGLVELGYEKVLHEDVETSNHCANLEFAQHAKDIGVDLSDNEMDAIVSGEYFDSSKCDLTED